MFQIAATIGLAEAHGFSWDFCSDIDDCAAGRLFNLRGGLERSTRPLTVYKEIKQVYSAIVLSCRTYARLKLFPYAAIFKTIGISLKHLTSILPLHMT